MHVRTKVQLSGEIHKTVILGWILSMDQQLTCKLLLLKITLCILGKDSKHYPLAKGKLSTD